MTQQPRSVIGVVQHYAWGDTEFIPSMLRTAPTGEPCAELWLGTHPNGPASFADGTTLESVTGPLPYLLKVLSAAEPLSLQAHPNDAQAVDGHRRGVYPDANSKPEILVALTRFEALCGIRPAAATLALLRDIGAVDLADVVAASGTDATMRGLYLGDIDPASTVAACSSSDRAEAVWVQTLDARYPGDPSVAVTLLLNHVVLQPGEAIHLTAGNLHGYLCGSGIELMRASDNVVRGGLTVKPVDLDELLRIIDPTPLVEPVMISAAASGRYPLPEAGVVLVRLDTGTQHTAMGHELAISMDGDTLYLSPGTVYTASAQTFVVTPDVTG